MREPKKILIDAIKKSPDLSHRALADAVFAEVAGDAIALRIVFEYWLTNTMKSIEVRRTKSSISVMKRRQRIFVGRNTRKKLKEVIVTALMTHVLSTGRELRHSTFGDCLRESGWLRDVGHCGRANEVVGNTLTEADLQSLYRRHLPRVAA